jgi:hypothetical protein
LDAITRGKKGTTDFTSQNKDKGKRLKAKGAALSKIEGKIREPQISQIKNDLDADFAEKED